MADQVTKPTESNDLLAFLNTDSSAIQAARTRHSVLVKQVHAKEAAKMSSNMEHELRQLLDEFDMEGTGTFDVSELLTISCSLGEPLADEECQLIIQELDPGDTGVVSFESFIKW